ncbi:dolichol-phosphate mannosyltransferase [Pedobacter cryoconitis]|uniref:Dolichol-phosphate mannosyltransferase n=1 Tax=Pedobacter cryoconitis TaxID=188932 RepID=A0A7W8ZLW3_9SPHI|nr:GtrA family protein [Pedobacter cryoconitis]MBB5636436.1 dolichol-phosphate mannosyltransferase [Pedobacter cryoconitis]
MPQNRFSIFSVSSLLTPKLLAFIKFGITGACGLIIDFSLTWFFKDELNFNKFLANGIGFSVAVICNYIINRNWTFKDNKSKSGLQFTAFFTVSLIGLLLNSAIIFLLNNMFSVNFYISKAAAIFIVFFWNFSANYFFVFKAPDKEKSI